MDTYKQIHFDCLTGETKIIEIPVEEIDIEFLRNDKQRELMESYKKSIVSGFNSMATGENVRYGYKEQDQLNYSKIANLFALNPDKQSTIIGSDSHGVVNLTREQFLSFMEDAEKYEMEMYVKRKQLEVRINNASYEELKNIEIYF